MIRHLNEQELKAWSKGIHVASSTKWLPALRSAYAHLMPFVDENATTAYTDCRYRIGLAPYLLDPETTTSEQLAVVIIHETMHNTQHHRQRLIEKKDLNGKLSNFVTDLEINSIIAEGLLDINLEKGYHEYSNGHWDYLLGEIVEEETEEGKKENTWNGVLLPRVTPFEDIPTNLTAEQYLEYFESETQEMSLDDLFKSFSSGNDAPNGSGDNQSAGNNGPDSDEEQENTGNCNSGSQNGGNGQQQGNNSSQDSSNSDSENSNGGDNASESGDGTGEFSDGWGGTASSHGNGSATVTKIYKKNADGTRTEVGRDAIVDRIDVNSDSNVWKEASDIGINPISRGEEQRIKESIAHEIEEQRRSSGYGNQAGETLLKYIERGLRPPVVDWKRMLARVTSRACQQRVKGHDDYSYQRTSRRYSQGKYIFPGLVSYIPTVRLAVDTSGSMSANEYQKVLSEAEGILRSVRAKIEFTAVDVRATEVKKVKNIQEVMNGLIGGGGTDMGVAVRQVCDENKKDRPDVLVIATDGIFNWTSFIETLKAPELKNTTVIVLAVYKFDEDSYFGQLNSVDMYRKEMQRVNRDAILVQAWT